jgi:C-terminal processing protease CtpA/Prc
VVRRLVPAAFLLALAACRGNTLKAFPEEYAGIGVELSTKEGPPRVVKSMPGSSALEHGIILGDEVIAIDEDTTRGMSLAQVVERLRGPPGSQVTLRVVRAPNGELLTFHLDRRPLKKGADGYRVSTATQ